MRILPVAIVSAVLLARRQPGISMTIAMYIAIAATVGGLLLPTGTLAQSDGGAGASGNTSESGAGANVRGSANMEAGIGGRVGANLGNSSLSGSTSMGTLGSGSARIGPTLDSAGVTGPTSTGLYGYGRETSPTARTGVGLDSAQSGPTNTRLPGYDGRSGDVMRDPERPLEGSLAVKIKPLTEPAMNAPNGAASAIVPPMKPAGAQN